jgi:outer membrane protein OmpA-like peptidoglycan-associated protein
VNRGPGSAGGPDPNDAEPATLSDDLEELRGLLLAKEQERLRALEVRLNDPGTHAAEVSRILPESIVLASREGPHLAAALTPAVEEALHLSIKKNRKHLAEAISPAMGPAIRRAIGEALRGMVESLNQVLQHSFSLHALGWRLEAWRTGKSFAEVVLSHSLVYRVEQVFLVHRETGLLLQHVAADEATAQDGDLISGMLTAIQDFVRDSFAGTAGEAVNTMQVGDLSVWVEQGPEAYIAAVIRGTPPSELRTAMNEALDGIQLQLGAALGDFSGDASPFVEAHPYLEDCLRMQLSERNGGRIWLAPTLLLAGLALAAGLWLAWSLHSGRLWSSYLARLDRQPGIVVISSGRSWRHFSLVGLRDPLAMDPASLLEGSGLAPERVTSRWEPYQSDDPEILLVRSRRLLEPPAGVKMTVREGVLEVAGAAPHRWVTAARSRAAMIPGVQGVRLEHLVDLGIQAVAALKARVEGLTLLFEPGAAELGPGQQSVLDELVAAMQDLAATARRADLTLAVEVIGHTDGTGSEVTNVRLSRARADWVVSALEAHGVGGVTFSTTGVGASQPLREERTEADRSQNRSVSFAVKVEP